MAYALRYYKELTHADGTVIRLEIHKKDSTTAAVEIGAVVQRLSLEIQGQQDDIDSPIQKTSLHMTFVDASDIENGQKNGFWQEFYTPDALMWKVILKAKDVTETSFRTIWGGYVTPDSFSEDLVYRGSVSITARDNIGHMQDFPFDAEGDADGMISLYNLVESGWEKIQSPMMLEWRGAAESTMWLMCDGVSAMFTLMNVSMFEGMDWYKAIETALASYGVVMRYVGNNIVKMSSLRSMPYQGEEFIEDLIHIEPTFVSGATRELIPAVKRIEENVGYDLGDEYQPRIDTHDFSGNTFDVETSWGTVENIAWSLLQSAPMSAFGWYNETPFKTLAFNPSAYEVDDRLSDSDKEDLHKYTCVLTGSKDDNTHSLSYAMSVNAEDFAINITFGKFLSRLTHGYGDYFLGYPANEPPADYSIRFAVKVQANGITYYLTENGVWSTEFASQKVVVSGDKMSVNVPLSGKYSGRVLVSFVFLNIDTSEEAVRVKQILALSLSSTSNKPMLENNTVNTNYQDENNVILTRDPELAPALNTTALPAFIKNGIFYRRGDVILPARKWSWGSGSEQQMAVWNHLQLLSYYAKPNNLISGTIVNADVTRAQAIYVWHGAEHILVSGTYNFLNGHIESAVLREFARYEDMWSEVAGADLPDTEQDSRSNVEGGSASGGSSSTYSNTTTVNIGSGGGGGTGASNLNDLLDVDTTGVVAQSVLYYNGTSWVDMSLNTLLNPYLKADVAAKTYASKSVYDALVASLGSLAYKNGLTASDIPDLSGIYLPTSGGFMNNMASIKWYANVHSWDDAPDGLIGVSMVSDALGYHGGLSYKGYYGLQIRAYGGDTDDISVRGYNHSAWGTWRTLYHSGNFNPADYLPKSGGTIESSSWGGQLTIKRTTTGGDVVIGFANTNGILGYFGFNKQDLPFYMSAAGTAYAFLHSGNIGEYAAGALVAQSTNNLDNATNQAIFSGTYQAYNRPASNYVTGITLYNTTVKYKHQLAFDTDNRLYARTNNTSAWSAWKTIAFTDSNVASAQALKHSNGTVGATAESTGRITFASNVTLGLNKSILDPSGRSIFMLDGNNSPQIGFDTVGSYSTYINGKDVYLRYGSSRTTGLILNSSGNVTIGGSDLAGTSAKLYVDGSMNLTAKGDNAEVFRLSTERAWAFYQVGSGAGAGLQLRTLSGGKAFSIGRDDASIVFTINTAASGATIVSDATIYPLASATHRLGTINYRWSNVYSVDGNFSGAVTMDSTLSVGGASTFNGAVSVLGTNLVVSATGNAGSGGAGVMLHNEGGIEISHATTPFIDFHYANSTSDYSVRLICRTANILAFTGSYFTPWSNGGGGLGTESVRWNILWVKGINTSGNTDVGGALSVGAGATITGNTTINGNLVVAGDISA